jgi:hypothetical protein
MGLYFMLRGLICPQQPSLFEQLPAAAFQELSPPYE